MLLYCRRHHSLIELSTQFQISSRCKLKNICVYLELDPMLRPLQEQLGHYQSNLGIP